ncbi:MAG: MFS transporter [Gemmataceae bacterium]
MKPSHVRFWIVGLTTLTAMLLYLDRFCLSFTERFMKEDMGLSNAQTDLLLSAFFWTYALAQVPSGWLSDRFGARLMLALYVLFWSLFTGLMGMATVFVAVLFLRFGVGLAQAGAYPTSAGVVSRWVPFRSRGLASSCVAFGGRIGGAAAPVLTAYLMVAFVPLTVSSLLTSQDVLNAPALSRHLLQREAMPASQLSDMLRTMLPAAASAELPELAARSPSAEVPPALVSGLNAVIARRDLYQHVDVNDFDLPQEARRLAALPDSDLTPPQIERRNRLLLEAAYPDAIRKVYGAGWRPVMYVYGIAGILVAVAFWFGVRDSPKEHPWCNTAEQERIAEGRPPGMASAAGPASRLPLRYIFASRSLWFSSLSQFGTNFGWVFLVLYLPRYLAEVHRVPVVERGWMAGLPVFIGMFGMLSGGWLTDWLTQRLGLRWGRALPMALTRFLGMGGFIACVFLESPWPITLVLAFVALTTDLGIPSVWAFMQDVGGKHVGSVLGWGNMWGNLAAALSPLILGRVLDHFAYLGNARNWDLVFVICAASFLLSGLAALGVDATKPVAPAEA